MCNLITVTCENVKDFIEGYILIFSVKNLGYMLNNIHVVAFYFLMFTMSLFAVSSKV